MSTIGGFIYVLTNPSFPEYVKIGYADNVDERISQLNRSECTPFAFRKYATLHVASRLADKNIHKIIDTFKPELRAKENINGKMRIREFFAMSADEAVELLKTIGGVYGETPQVYDYTEDEKAEEKIANETAIATERRSPFSFYKCGIDVGETVVYINDKSIVCTVVSDREISFKGKKTSLTALAKKLLNKDSGIQGTLYFKYNGEVLSALRKRLEDEGKYIESMSAHRLDSELLQPNSTTESNGIPLFFTMQKYPATCLWSKKGFLLLKGSKVSKTMSTSCRKTIKDLRNKYCNQIDVNGNLLLDILFESSSSVAMFVSGSSLNGKVYWKDSKGILLKDLMIEEN